MNILMVIVSIITAIWFVLAFMLSIALIFEDKLFTPKQAIFNYSVIPFMCICIWYWS